MKRYTIKFRPVFLISISLVVWSAVQAFATIYFVNRNHPQASDGNNGAETSPWATIQKAADVLRPGDTAIVKDGTYNERVRTTVSGVEDTLIVFRAAPGATATIQGLYFCNRRIIFEGFRITGPGDGAPVVFRYDSDHLVLRNCDLDERHIVRTNYTDFINFEYPPSGHTAPRNITISGCKIHGYNGNDSCKVIVNMTGDNHLFESNEIYDSDDADVFNIAGSDCVIRNNFIHDLLDSADVHIDCVQVMPGAASRGVLFEGNRVFNFPGDGAVCQINSDANGSSREWTFRNNVFSGISRYASIAVRSYWYNNVFFQCTPALDHVLLFVNQGSGDASGSACINNIFIGCGKSSSTGWYSSSGLTTFTHSHNYAANGASAHYSTKTDFNVPSGINGGDPRFTDPVRGDFSLQAGSPAINTGKNLSIYFTKDINGIPRPQGTEWDIGAYEYAPAALMDPEIRLQRARQRRDSAWHYPIRPVTCKNLPLSRKMRLVDLSGSTITLQSLATGVYVCRNDLTRTGYKIIVGR